MYYPYFRGKQFELVLLREKSGFISSNLIKPIIEPVKSNMSSLRRALGNLVDSDAQFVVIINPQIGDLEGAKDDILDLIEDVVPSNYGGISLGYIVNQNTNLERLGQVIEEGDREDYSIIHYGYTDGARLSGLLNGNQYVTTHMFIDGYASKLYRRHFRVDDVGRVLIRDGFRVMKNEDYPEHEHFSDLHITHKDERMDSFGDFLMVGDEYREAGGPAYAVAIHLTYLDKEGDMFVGHFVSEQRGSPTNPAGKFQEALEKLVDALDEPGSLFFCSEACKEYKSLYERGHFPGLGYVKKLSMQHHLELMADFLNRT